MENIQQLMYLAGVSGDYLDYSGQFNTIPHADRVRVLRACGYDVEDQQAIRNAVFELDAKPWESWLRPWYVVAQEQQQVAPSIHPEQLDAPLDWQLETEQGEQINGQVIPRDCPECGDYSIGALRYSARQLPLPSLPLGYHQLTLSAGKRSEQALLMVCPPRSYSPLGAEERLWGVSCQLYTLRSPRNWGVGDFTDLLELVHKSQAQGADFIGLNPLHALCSDSPDAASPYSPSDRRFINPLYIDVTEVPEYKTAAVQQLLQGSAHAAELEFLRQQPLVDYDRINILKYKFFDVMYQQFVSQQLSAGGERAGQFREFVKSQGRDLQDFANYEVNHNRYTAKASNEAQFYCYLQWLAFTQWRQCQQRALAAGMRMGLLGDLAVGSVGQGCEVKTNPELYLSGVTIGAPPDPIALGGQDWGLPVINPVALKASGFRHFRTLLRTNMQNCGGLRVDHAMALMRLWWCLPADEHGAATGVYVFYPLQDMLALLRLESVRNKCMIIGEDLGVVPAEFRHAMAESGIFSNNLMYFEQHYDQYFKPPHEHQVDALLMITNHDVSTLADWWNRDDLQRRFKLGLLAGEQDLHQQLTHRDQEKQKLLNWLADSDLLPHNRGRTDLTPPMDYPLCASIHQICARTASQLVLLQLEDLQLMEEPVNIPGTYREYPNWRRKQAGNTSDIFSSAHAQHILNLMSKERNRD